MPSCAHAYQVFVAVGMQASSGNANSRSPAPFLALSRADHREAWDKAEPSIRGRLGDGESERSEPPGRVSGSLSQPGGMALSAD